MGVGCHHAPLARACLAEPRACAASQGGGVMDVAGYDSCVITATISDGAISGCSSVAGVDDAVRARHAAQRGPSLGWWGEVGQGVAEEGGRLRGLLHFFRWLGGLRGLRARDFGLLGEGIAQVFRGGLGGSWTIRNLRSTVRRGLLAFEGARPSTPSMVWDSSKASFPTHQNE